MRFVSSFALVAILLSAATVNGQGGVCPSGGVVVNNIAVDLNSFGTASFAAQLDYEGYTTTKNWGFNPCTPFNSSTLSPTSKNCAYDPSFFSELEKDGDCDLGFNTMTAPPEVVNNGTAIELNYNVTGSSKSYNAVLTLVCGTSTNFSAVGKVRAHGVDGVLTFYATLGSSALCGPPPPPPGANCGTVTVNGKSVDLWKLPSSHFEAKLSYEGYEQKRKWGFSPCNAVNGDSYNNSQNCGGDPAFFHEFSEKSGACDVAFNTFVGTPVVSHDGSMLVFTYNVTNSSGAVGALSAVVNVVCGYGHEFSPLYGTFYAHGVNDHIMYEATLKIDALC